MIFPSTIYMLTNFRRAGVAEGTWRRTDESAQEVWPLAYGCPPVSGQLPTGSKTRLWECELDRHFALEAKTHTNYHAHFSGRRA